MQLHLSSLIKICLLLSISPSILAQYGATIRTARPGNTIGAFTVGKNVFQIQSGIAYHALPNTSMDDDFTPKNFRQTNVFRFGITETVELSSVWGARRDWLINDERKGGIHTTQFGIRFNITEGNQKGIPSVGVQYRLFVPTPTKDYRANYVGSKAILAFGYSLAPQHALISNLAISWNGNTPIPAGGYSFRWVYKLASSFKLNIEHYGNLKSKQLNTGFDLGIAYVLNPNLQLDVLGGWDLVTGNGKKGIEHWFVETGISWRWRKQNRSK